MDKTQYLKTRLQKDLFRYIILRKGGKSANEIAHALEVTASGLKGCDILGHLREETSSRMQSVIDREFSFDRIKENGAFVAHLPEGFGPELINKVVQEYRSFLRSDMMIESETQVVARLLRKIEKEAWRSGLTNLSEGIAKFIEMTDMKAREYRACCRPADYRSDLDEIYAKALKTRGGRGNSDAIIALRSCLREAAMQECQNVIYNDVADFLHAIASDSSLASIAAFAESVRLEAVSEDAGLAVPEAVGQWDSEYEKKIPVDFYSRNIEKVDEYKAFYMSVMYAFARYEQELIDRGYLTDGEISIFTGARSNGPSALISDILSILTDFVMR